MVRKYYGGALNLLSVNPEDYISLYPEPPPLPPRRSSPRRYSSVQDEILSKIKRQDAINTNGYQDLLERIREQKRRRDNERENPFNISSYERSRKPSMNLAFDIADEIKRKYGDKSNISTFETEKPKVGKLNISEDMKKALASIYGHGYRRRRVTGKGTKEMKQYMAYVRSFRRKRS